MVAEIRTYRTQPGMRQRFLDFFRRRSMPAMAAYGMGVIGPYESLEDPDVFVWLRTFPSLEERDRMLEAFYEGPVWKNELEAIVMPMLVSYESVLALTRHDHE